MKLRFFVLMLLLPSSFISVFPKHHDHHHYYANSTTHDLIEIIKEKDSEIFWTKVEYSTIAGAAGILVGYVLAKLRGQK